MTVENKDLGKPEVNSNGHKLRGDGSGLYDTGRAKKDLDVNLFEEACKLHCTLPEICGLLRMTDKTLNERLKELYGCTFSVIYDELAAEGKMSLRRAQMKAAIEDGNVNMQKFLGMNILGQIERSKSDVQERIIYHNEAKSLSDEALDNALQEFDGDDEEGDDEQ